MVLKLFEKWKRKNYNHFSYILIIIRVEKMYVNLINLDTFEGSYDYEMGWNRAQRVQVVCN